MSKGGVYCRWKCENMCQMCMDAEMRMENDKVPGNNLLDVPNWHGWETGDSEPVDHMTGGRGYIDPDVGYNIIPIKNYSAPKFVEPPFVELEVKQIKVVDEMKIEGLKRLKDEKIVC